MLKYLFCMFMVVSCFITTLRADPLPSHYKLVMQANFVGPIKGQAILKLFKNPLRKVGEKVVFVDGNYISYDANTGTFTATQPGNYLFGVIALVFPRPGVTQYGTIDTVFNDATTTKLQLKTLRYEESYAVKNSTVDFPISAYFQIDAPFSVLESFYGIYYDTNSNPDN